MARRSITGQLNMFDLFNSYDMMEPGEVEMVSLVPNFEEEFEKQEEPERQEESEVRIVEEASVPEKIQLQKVKTEEKVSMSRCYMVDGEKIEIAYINYNKVRITKGNETPIIKEFASTKEAVDYYVEQMQEFEIDE